MRVRWPRLAILVGVCLVAYGGVALLWGDPLTGSYTRLEQRRLASELESRRPRTREPVPHPRRQTAPKPRPAAPPRGVARGHALGWILIPAIGVKAVFVEGTRTADLRKGPGHYEMTALPGAGRTVAIAGHRTTYGAFFRHIDDLRRGDTIVLRLAYGEFRYVVFGHRIVDRRDWTIIRRRPFETLVLSACHPLFSAAQRWVVFARLASATRPRGQPPARAAVVRASSSYEAT
jgi:sortase A